MAWPCSRSPVQKSRKPDWDKVYRVHPILAHTKTPIKAPLLALPYGKPNLPREKYREYQNLHIQAVSTFAKLLSTEALADPIPTVQGILRSCFDLQDLRSEVGGAGGGACGWGKLGWSDGRSSRGQVGRLFCVIVLM